MLRISKLTDYATVILCFLARSKNDSFAATEVADGTGIALPTVSKILKLLVKAEILHATRGAKGGHRLAKAPAKISVADIINVLEGPIAITECSISLDGCQQSSVCEIKGNWAVLNKAIRTALESVSLADLVISPAGQPNEIQEINVPVASINRP